MEICKTRAIYFSPTHTTRKVVEAIGRTVSAEFGTEYSTYDFTTPAKRQSFPQLADNEIVIVGLPVYAGRLPNLLLPYLSTFDGGGAYAIAVVLFGGRSYGDALMELRDILQDRNFRVIAAAAMVGEHSFSPDIFGGRPLPDDLAAATTFASNVCRALRAGNVSSPVPVDGTPHPYSGYFKPADKSGKPINILKVKPLTTAACTNCHRCAELCPMGAIDGRDSTIVGGTCIKCCACVRFCPQGAKYFDDAGFLTHVSDLKEFAAKHPHPQNVFFEGGGSR